MFARIFEYKFTNLDQAKIAANHLSMELGDKIEKFNINSFSITIGKCASISIVCKFENNSDMQNFEQFCFVFTQTNEANLYFQIQWLPRSDYIQLRK